MELWPMAETQGQQTEACSPSFCAPRAVCGPRTSFFKVLYVPDTFVISFPAPDLSRQPSARPRSNPASSPRAHKVSGKAVQVRPARRRRHVQTEAPESWGLLRALWRTQCRRRLR